MRLCSKHMNFIKETLGKSDITTEIYLFGSRVNDDAKGGDIDILILSDKYFKQNIIRNFKVNFYKNFGWQKIDVVNFLFNESHPFKDIALDKAIKL